MRRARRPVAILVVSALGAASHLLAAPVPRPTSWQHSTEQTIRAIALSPTVSYVATDSEITALTNADGRVLWRKPLTINAPKDIYLTPTNGGLLVGLSSTQPGSGCIEARSSTTGDLRRIALPGPLSSRIVVRNRNAFFLAYMGGRKGPEHLVIVNLDTMRIYDFLPRYSKEGSGKPGGMPLNELISFGKRVAYFDRTGNPEFTRISLPADMTEPESLTVVSDKYLIGFYRYTPMDNGQVLSGASHTSAVALFLYGSYEELYRIWTFQSTLGGDLIGLAALSNFVGEVGGKLVGNSNYDCLIFNKDGAILQRLEGSRALAVTESGLLITRHASWTKPEPVSYYDFAARRSVVISRPVGEYRYKTEINTRGILFIQERDKGLRVRYEPFAQIPNMTRSHLHKK